MRMIAALSTVALGVALTACEDREPHELPTESYSRPPKNPRSDDYVVKLENMISSYDVPGEAGYLVEGADHGFESLSFILTETQPRGGAHSRD